MTHQGYCQCGMECHPLPHQQIPVWMWHQVKLGAAAKDFLFVGLVTFFMLILPFAGAVFEQGAMVGGYGGRIDLRVHATSNMCTAL